MVKNPNKYMKLGIKTDLENKIRSLEAAIITATTVISTSLFTTGDVNDIDVATARAEFDRMEENMDALEQSRRELDRLENL